jgi:hypothetical protein
MHLPRLRILGPLVVGLLSTLLTLTQGAIGIPVWVLTFAWGLVVGVVVTVVGYALNEEPPLRTKKTYRIPIDSVVVRFHMRKAWGMDDPIPKLAGVLCAKDDANMDYTLYEPLSWYCHLCDNRVPLGIEDAGRALALRKWRNEAPSDE